MTDQEQADPVRLLRELTKIDTGPGCLDHVAAALSTVSGVEIEHADDISLVLRIPGCGAARPLLLHGTADIAPVDGQLWRHGPFDAEPADGPVWGRRAASGKHGLAMMIAALLRLDAQGERPAGDVVLAVVANGKLGAKHLVDEHADLFTGIRCAIGREADADIRLPGAVAFHPIVVAEKRACLVRVTIAGADGDAALLAPSDSPMAQLGMLLTALSGARLARRRTPVVERMLDDLAAALPDSLSAAVHRLSTDHANDRVPASLPLPQALFIDSLMRNTANPVAIHTDRAADRTPARVRTDIDCRLLPGCGTEAFLAELRTFTGSAQVEVLHEDPLPDNAKSEFGPFYNRLVEILTKADPDAVPLPVLTPGSTEAAQYSRLGIHCYGWLPQRLPESPEHRGLSHSADERIPASALQFGADRMTELLRDFP
ncbi:M20/M25/M40 family metallo-hydrolase [Kutzneria sp. NPDC052558]|uniref:M20/M25/M40 family metallo-hydrolase n=1 Tax=Kutzneria sp. NPDC052558 TaxID=3364121 RepID=UPI0037C8B590